MAHACPQCDTEIADGALFCHACGTPQAAASAPLSENTAAGAPRCADCGQRNPVGASYCERCGSGLTALLSPGDLAEPAAAAPTTSRPPPAAPVVPSSPAPGRSRAPVPDEDTFDPLSAPTLVMAHTAPAPLLPLVEGPVARPGRRARITRVAVAAGVLLVAALAVWLLSRGSPEQAAVPATQPASSPTPRAPASAAVLPTAPVAAPAASAAASAPVPASPAPANALPASPAPANALPASTVQVATPASTSERRLRKPEPVSRKRALEAVPPRVASEPAAAPPPAPAAAPPAPERARTVAETCAGGNLLTRGFCEQRECRKADLAGDPLCVKLRDTEQRRLFQQ